MSHSKLVNAAIVFATPDVKKTAWDYRDVLGFRVVEHFYREEKIAPLFSDIYKLIRDLLMF